MSPQPLSLVVHATQEAGLKLGGIGAVLDGLLSSPAYNAAVDRTILVGPVNTWNAAEMARLTAPGGGLRTIYSSLPGREANTAPERVARALQDIEARMNVRFVYAVRGFGRYEHEVILVDAGTIAGNVIDSFKFHLWQNWGLSCIQHQSNWEFSFFLNAGEPLYAAIDAVAGDTPPAAQRFIIAHEWLGLPVVFSARLRNDARYKSLFYAHEVATARLLVEAHGGHDTRFYNALRLGIAQGHTLDEVFGDHAWFYKHAMVLRAGVCDRLLAVGDPTLDELRFLGGVFRPKPIDLVYNGVPAAPISLEQKAASRALMLQYAQNLYGYRPDYIFTHVTRMVTSKALWRDIRVLEHLEWALASQGKRAVFFVVSTAVPTGRSAENVLRWEADYGWPVSHRSDNGDLEADETHFFFNVLEPFHWGRSAIRICLVNQFGWERGLCGWRMPEEMRFSDLRVGTDLEFGQSIYEPFGIAQLEPLGAGALCVPSSVCGCVGFVQRAAGGIPDNIIVGDYAHIPSDWPLRSPWEALGIDAGIRDSIEARNSYLVAQQIAQRLPKTDGDLRRLIGEGQRTAASMSWEVVVREHLLPALRATA